VRPYEEVIKSKLGDFVRGKLYIQVLTSPGDTFLEGGGVNGRGMDKNSLVLL